MAQKVTPGSITQTADAQKDRIANISNVSRAISQMQKDVDQKITETKKEVQDNKSATQVHQSMNQTLAGLNQTIGALTQGVSKITSDTARATSDVVRQYGRAISQDISFNKKSVVAMALSQTSPLYGYFVSKFMETDVFKRALNRMKTSISQTIGAIVRPLKGKGAVKGGAEVPHMQTGGHVQQGGMARLHAGETVIPAGRDTTPILQEMLNVQKQQNIYMRSVFGVWSEAGFGDKMKDMFSKMASPFKIPWKIGRMFRKTKGIYRGQLSRDPMPLRNIADNVATLFEGLMWRLDNMMEIMKANAQANRDHSSFVTGIKYDPIPGVALRRPAFSLIRKAGKMALAPASFALKGLIGGALGTAGILSSILSGDEDYMIESGNIMKFLTKKRGLYKDEPGIGKSIKRKLMPRSRQQLLGQYENLDESDFGGAGGPGPYQLSPFKQAQIFSRVFGKELGGDWGEKRPIWVRLKKEGWSVKAAKAKDKREQKQTKSLSKIQDSTEQLNKTQRQWFKKVKEWRFIGQIFKFLGFGWNLLKMPFKLLGNVARMLSGPLLKLAGWLGLPKGALAFLKLPLGTALKTIGSALFSTPVLGVIGAGLAGYGIGSIINKYLIEPWVQQSIDEKMKEASEDYKKVTAKIGEYSKTAAELGTAEGYTAKVITKAAQFGKAPGGFLTEVQGGDVQLGTIRKGQLDFIIENAARYERFPMDKLPEWRREWQNTPEGRGGRAQFLSFGSDPYKYGVGRERKFLEWLEANRSEITMGAEEKARAAQRTAVMGTTTGKARTIAAEAKAGPKTGYAQMSYEERMKKGKDIAARHLMEKHSLQRNFAEEWADIIMEMGGANISDPEKLKQFSSSVYQQYVESGGSWLHGLVGKISESKAKEIGAGVAERMGVSIQSATITSNEVGIEAATVKIGNKDLKESIDKQTEEIKDSSEKQAKVTVASSQHVVNNMAQSSQNTTNVGGGGQSSTLDSQDPHSQRNVSGTLQ